MAAEKDPDALKTYVAAYTEPGRGRFIHPDGGRAITTLECARLPGYPDSWLWHGTKASVERQVGNSVPLYLGRAVGTALRRSLGIGDASIPYKNAALADF